MKRVSSTAALVGLLGIGLLSRRSRRAALPTPRLTPG